MTHDKVLAGLPFYVAWNHLGDAGITRSDTCNSRGGGIVLINDSRGKGGLGWFNVVPVAASSNFDQDPAPSSRGRTNGRRLSGGPGLHYQHQEKREPGGGGPVSGCKVL